MRIFPAMLNTEENERNILLTVLLTKSKQMVAKTKKSICWRKEKPFVENMGQQVQFIPGKILIGHKRRIFFFFNNFFYCEGNQSLEYWKNLLKDVVDSLTLETFKVWLDKVLHYLAQALLSAFKMDQMTSEVPSNLGFSKILILNFIKVFVCLSR